MFITRKIVRIAIGAVCLFVILFTVTVIEYAFRASSSQRQDSSSQRNESFEDGNQTDRAEASRLDGALSCRREGLKVLYFVHTAPGNAVKRAVLRRTIGDRDIEAFVNSALLFFVGEAQNVSERRAVEEEANREGDIIVLNFTDTYRNLTLKFLHAARWVSDNCNLTDNTTIVKMDDDVLVNVFALSSYVSSRAMALNGIHCLLYAKVKPYRKKDSKWYVSKEQYSPDKYPAYCAGAAYMMRPSVLATLYEQATHVPVYWVDDVYVTGILASLARIDMVDITRYFSYAVPNGTETVKKGVLFVNVGSPNHIYQNVDLLWQSVLRTNGSLGSNHRWRVRARHRKALPWLQDWIVSRNTSAESREIISR